MLPRLLGLLLAAATALVLFLDYFLPAPLLNDLSQPLLNWIVQLSAAALLLAAFHLVRRHASRWRRAPADALVLVAFTVTFVAGLLPAGFESGAGRWLYRWLISPGLAALFALLPIFLAYALARHLRLRDLGTLLLGLSLLLVLAGQIPLAAERMPWLAALRHNLLAGPAAAAFRGVLIGLALGAILAAFGRWRRLA